MDKIEARIDKALEWGYALCYFFIQLTITAYLVLVITR